ncbi:NACHT domain-containing NTPase [Saccharopolyspora gloriosae]|uniref:NACHT domain-containing protein n=1 Tax=Saccharopolyspora gloriosae TaxID=455344 RepID=UPI001FB6E5A7|nr:NACHT domain-containing protein [Saccharopolyspora gloriosae]
MQIPHFTAIHDTYRAISSKRLVILGGAGAGKSVLAHRLILDLLGSAGSGPVPVLFSLGDWNPATTGLRNWLIRQLLRDYPSLERRDRTTRQNGAEELVDQELILPVLDGFDELPEQHHLAAIGDISSLDMPVIVTSRPDEYASAVRSAKAVGGAAAIELEDLGLDESHRYLRHSAGKDFTPGWDAVFDRLRRAAVDTPAENLRTTLTTPLMVMLARATYNDGPGRHPHELLDAQRFPTRADLEEHLLASYLRLCYDDRDTGSPHPVRARRWLSHLATQLSARNTHDLTWWQLPAGLHRHTRVLTTATAVGAAIWLVYGLWQALGYVTPGAATVLAHAALIGLVVGLIKEAGFVRGQAGQEPGRFRLRLRLRNRAGIARKPSGQSLNEFFKGIVVGAVVGLVAGQGLVSELSAGLVIGLVGGVAGAALDERAALRARMDGEMFKVIAALATTAIAIPVAFTFSIELPLGMVAGVLAAGPSVREYRLWRGIPLGFLVLTTDGLFAGIAVGVAFGLVNVAVSALGEAHEPDAADPWILLSTDRSVTLVQTILAVPAIVLAAVLVLDAPIETGIMYGLFGGIVRLTLSAWGSWLLFTRLWLPLTGRLPLRPKRFLEDAYQRGILRRTGATYQFRHARLRDHLRALPPPGAGRHQAR